MSALDHGGGEPGTFRSGNAGVSRLRGRRREPEGLGRGRARRAEVRIVPGRRRWDGFL